MTPFSAVKVFSCTMARDRDALGDRITEWLRAHPELKPVETEVTQTSDYEFHCLTVTLFLEGDPSKLLQEQTTAAWPSRPAPAPEPTRLRSPGTVRPVVPTARGRK